MRPRHEPTGAARTAWLLLLLLAAGLAGVVVLVARPPAQDPGTGPATPPAGPGYDLAAAEAHLLEAEESVAQALEQGRPDFALPPAQNLVAFYPRFAPARRLLAQVLVVQDQFEPAYAELMRALELDPRQPAALELAGVAAMKLQRWDAAETHFRAVMALEPRQVRHRLNLAQVAISRRDPDAARDLLLGALQVDSGSHKAHALLADVYGQQNRTGLALEQIGRALDLLPAREKKARVDYTRKRAMLLRRDNRAEEALQVLRGLSDAERRELPVIDDMAVCLGMMGQPAAAAGLFEERLVWDPSDYLAAARAAQWHLKAADKPAAARLLEVVRRINPRAAEIEGLEKALRGE